MRESKHPKVTQVSRKGKAMISFKRGDVLLKLFRKKRMSVLIIWTLIFSFSTSWFIQPAAAEERRSHAFVDSLGIRNEAVNFYYYEQLPAEDKQVYEAMYRVASRPGTTDFVVTLPVAWDVSDNAQWANHYWKVEWAISYDHPELWWIDPANGTYRLYVTYSTVANADGTHDIYIRMNEAYPNAEKDIAAFNQAAESLLAKVDKNAGEESIARQVHDLLLETVTYNNRVFEDQSGDLARTAYSALVCDSQGTPHASLCSGYAKAYQYLLQQLGMETVVVEGMASSMGGEYIGHVWNVVKINGSWQEVDVTWNDSLSEYAQSLYLTLSTSDNRYTLFYEAAHDADFMDKVSHTLFMLKTSEISSLNKQMRYTASNGYYWDWQHYSNRYRFSESDPQSVDGLLMAMAPIA